MQEGSSSWREAKDEPYFIGFQFVYGGDTSSVVGIGHVPTQLADSGLIAQTPKNDKVTFNDIPEFFEVEVEGWNTSSYKSAQEEWVHKMFDVERSEVLTSTITCFYLAMLSRSDGHGLQLRPSKQFLVQFPSKLNFCSADSFR